MLLQTASAQFGLTMKVYAAGEASHEQEEKRGDVPFA